MSVSLEYVSQLRKKYNGFFTIDLTCIKRVYHYYIVDIISTAVDDEIQCKYIFFKHNTFNLTRRII